MRALIDVSLKTGTFIHSLHGDSMSDAHKISASMEDYLEAIFHIETEKGAARAKDISQRLKVNHSSVTGALQALSSRDLVNYAPYDLITLTPMGKKIARDVIRRHDVLTEFFVKVLDIDETLAEEGACNMEHAMPRSVLKRLAQYIAFQDACPRMGREWIKGFGHTCDNGKTVAYCERCISACLEEVKKK